MHAKTTLTLESMETAAISTEETIGPDPFPFVIYKSTSWLNLKTDL